MTDVDWMGVGSVVIGDQGTLDRTSPGRSRR
jgi:hypothetical protein